MGRTRHNYELELPSALEFDIRCQTARKSFEWQTHPVTIGTDWSVVTPHDLDAERIAAAFGGWVSCLQLENAVTAARHGILLGMRRQKYPLWRDFNGRWQICHPAPHSGSFVSAALAATYLRSPRHLAAKFDAPEWQVRALKTELERIFGGQFAPPAEANDDLREKLWHYGLHPDTVTRLTTSTGVGERVLPFEFWLGAAYSGVSRKWLRSVLPRATTDTDAVTLAWARASADHLESWLDIGFLPTERQFTTMVSLGAARAPNRCHPAFAAPSPAAIASLASMPESNGFDDTDLAILLALARKPNKVLRRLRADDAKLREHLSQVHEARR